MNIDINELAGQLSTLSRKPEDLDPKVEASHVAEVVNSLGDTLSDYSNARAEGVGGSGIVLSAVYNPFGPNARRAIKLPRKRLYKAAADSEGVVDVDPELHALSKLSHPHITRLYQSIKLPSGNGYCVITEYVLNPEPLDHYAEILCGTEQCRRDSSHLEEKLVQLAEVVHRVIDALVYMHESAKLFHFDLKPDNILVSASGWPYVTDLGFARDTTKYSQADRVSVGFTWKYAHSKLTDPHTGARVSQSAAKSKNVLPAADLSPSIDLFAFGRTLQEVLKLLENVHGKSIHSSYVFGYLHAAACLCLDGFNAANGGAQTRQSFLSDEALGIPAAVFKAHKFSSFSELNVAFMRLLGVWSLERSIPELNPWAASSINVSDLGVTTLTPRVSALLNHPAMQRLAGELQLGMLDTVYPTASHTRLQHSLGAYHSTTQYIAALYYDPDNPLFRLLFSVRKCVCTLVAALIHDLGQTAFGHDLEEVDSEEFDHGKLGAHLFESRHYKDGKGRTVRALIEENTTDSWNVPIDEVNDLLRQKPHEPADTVYIEILNGQLDADKADYLLRDSVETRLRYGLALDWPRFLRSLTVSATGQGSKAALRLAIKQKGTAAAQSFAFARYQLFQSLYWHHTFRAVKAHLLTAAAETIQALKANTRPAMFEQNPLRHAYLQFVMGVPQEVSSKGSGARKGKAEPTLQSLLLDKLSSDTSPDVSGKYAGDATLRFIWKLSEGKSRLLIEDLMSRRYYKRLLELPIIDLREDSWERLRDLVKSGRLELQQRIERALVNTLRSAIQDQMKSRQSLVTDKALERLEELASQRHLFIPDLPLRGWLSSGSPPIFVDDFKRRHFRADLVAKRGKVQENLWTKHLFDLMKESAYFRIFCEPEVHDILRKVLELDQVLASIREALPELSLKTD